MSEHVRYTGMPVVDIFLNGIAAPGAATDCKHDFQPYEGKKRRVPGDLLQCVHCCRVVQAPQ